MGKTIDKRVIKTKKLIKTTFLDLLSKTDFDKITVTLIAKEAHIDRKTFYFHYANTKELLEEFGEDLLNQAITRLDESEEFDVKLLFKTFNEIFRENETLFQEVIRTRINEFLIDLVELRVIQLLRRKLLANVANPPELAHYHLRYITTGLISIYVEWLRSNDDMSIDELACVARSIVAVNFENLEGLCHQVYK